jgi:hypothetical protein
MRIDTFWGVKIDKLRQDISEQIGFDPGETITTAFSPDYELELLGFKGKTKVSVNTEKPTTYDFSLTKRHGLYEASGRSLRICEVSLKRLFGRLPARLYIKILS